MLDSPTNRWSLTILYTSLLIACGGGTTDPKLPEKTSSADAPADGGQSTVVDELSQKNVVGIAVGSPDHTTLVTAVKAAELVDALSNAGPFTVFAPTNTAFETLPAGTMDGLLKPEKKADLQTVLQYHVFVGVLKPEQLRNGQSIDMVDGGKTKVVIADGRISINGANIVASVPASNGIVHVIDKVLLPGQ